MLVSTAKNEASAYSRPKPNYRLDETDIARLKHKTRERLPLLKQQQELSVNLRACKITHGEILLR